MNKIEHALLKSRHLNLAEIDSATITPLIDHIKDQVAFSAVELDKKRIIHPSCKDQSQLNYFRELRAKLEKYRSAKVILVTAVSPRSGSSFIALNLSAVIALDHSRTALLIDAHIENPSNTRLLEMEDEQVGLTDYFDHEDLSVGNIITPTGIQRLKLIPSGKDSELGKEYFTGKHMKNLINELRERYHDRTIIIDSPCILTSADSRIIAEYCDSVILVAPYGKVSEASILEAANEVGKEKLAGVIINKMY